VPLHQTVLTRKQLARYNGAGPPTHSKRIYLAILGAVFDVTDGAKHYGEQGTHAKFVKKTLADRR